MTSTLAYEYGKNTVPERAYGYSNDAGVWLETDQSPTSATLGDGGVYTNLEDLSKWDDALRNHTLLSESEFRPAITAATLPGDPQHRPLDTEGKPSSYGFGWFLGPYGSQERMWHTGSSMGFRTVIERFTKENLTIIILSNRTDLDPAALALRVADVYFASAK
jgi:CubicO group peptidase (beta-lactamase class C family)